MKALTTVERMPQGVELGPDVLGPEFCVILVSDSTMSSMTFMHQQQLSGKTYVKVRVWLFDCCVFERPI
jgi:hypothetical protein